MINPNKQPLITHVPTPKEFADLKAFDEQHDPSHALRPDQVGIIFHAMGLETPTGRLASTRETHEPKEAITVTEEQAPYNTETGLERTLHGDELRAVREQAQQILREKQ